MSDPTPRDDEVIRRLQESLDQRSADFSSSPAFTTRVARQVRFRRAANRAVATIATAVVIAGAFVVGANVLALDQRVELVDPPAAAPPASDTAPSDDASNAPAAPAASETEAPLASAAATPPPSDDAPSPVPELAAALLQPDDVTILDIPWRSWDRAAPPESSADLFDPCRPTAYPTDAQRTEVRTGDLAQDVEAEPDMVRQIVARYPSSQVAADALAGFRRVAEACPARTYTEGGLEVSETTRIVDDAPDRLLIHTVPEIGLYSSYAIIERRGDVVTLATYLPSHSREADDLARGVADAVSARLDAASR